MAGKETSRRGFLQVTGAGIAGSALTIGALPGRANFAPLKAHASAGLQILKFNNVQDLNIYQSRPIPDIHVDKVDKKSF